jgi:hypothetical protein
MAAFYAGYNSAEFKRQTGMRNGWISLGLYLVVVAAVMVGLNFFRR